MLKLHIDTDLGGDIDDLCALAMALHWPDVELLAVTTVAEHQGKRAGYLRYALSLIGREDILSEPVRMSHNIFIALGKDYLKKRIIGRNRFRQPLLQSI